MDIVEAANAISLEPCRMEAITGHFVACIWVQEYAQTNPHRQRPLELSDCPRSAGFPSDALEMLRKFFASSAFFVVFPAPCCKKSSRALKKNAHTPREPSSQCEAGQMHSEKGKSLERAHRHIYFHSPYKIRMIGFSRFALFY